jgi:hypothetical protein
MAMPIAQFLNGSNFDPETKRVMGVAYEMTHAALRLTDPDDPINEIIAKKIIELAKAGEANPDRICEQVLAHFQGHMGQGPTQANCAPTETSVPPDPSRRGWPPNPNG